MFKNIFSRRNALLKEIVPDKPIGFGYKNKWLAVKSNDNNKVAEFLEFKKVRKSNWEEGIKFGYEKGVFLTPGIKGWILVLGVDIADLQTKQTRELLEKVSEEFGECQIFFTHRIVEYHFWGFAIDGKIIRLYSYLGESNENLVIEGQETKVEQEYKLVNLLSEETNNDSKDIYIPNEETVMEIAESWSINPTKIEEYDGIEGIGLIGK